MAHLGHPVRAGALSFSHREYLEAYEDRGFSASEKLGVLFSGA